MAWPIVRSGYANRTSGARIRTHTGCENAIDGPALIHHVPNGATSVRGLRVGRCRGRGHTTKRMNRVRGENDQTRRREDCCVKLQHTRTHNTGRSGDILQHKSFESATFNMIRHVLCYASLLPSSPSLLRHYPSILGPVPSNPTSKTTNPQSHRSGTIGFEYHASCQRLGRRMETIVEMHQTPPSTQAFSP
jgi:hypothetical protein